MKTLNSFLPTRFTNVVYRVIDIQLRLVHRQAVITLVGVQTRSLENLLVSGPKGACVVTCHVPSIYDTHKPMVLYVTQKKTGLNCGEIPEHARILAWKEKRGQSRQFIKAKMKRC